MLTQICNVFVCSRELFIKKQPLGRIRLDKHIMNVLGLKKHSVKVTLAQGLVSVDGVTVNDADFIVDKFSKICVKNETLPSVKALYIMMHKPKGVVSATTDTEHKTVLDLVSCEHREQLHIVGRLDLNTTGLILLTNDSRWSEKLTLPEHKVAKTYQVRLRDPLTPEYISAFEVGMYFSFEGITTKPAILSILEPNLAEVTLSEGRYHQIKRMFGRFRNPVLALHRSSIGNLQLDESLAEGESRYLTQNEVLTIF